MFQAGVSEKLVGVGGEKLAMFAFYPFEDSSSSLAGRAGLERAASGYAEVNLQPAEEQKPYPVEDLLLLTIVILAGR